MAFALLSWRERLRTDRRWWRFSERPSWRPPDVEFPSLPSLRPEAASDKQLKETRTHEKHPDKVFGADIFYEVHSHLSTGGATTAEEPAGCSAGVD